ncbi:MAG: antitoxin ParD1/3/4 [Akkermansiaceae bacterium]|jgi:antitoxin ParD1/3/4
MNVSLTDRLDGFVENQVSSGRYRSASEVVREGLRLLETREQQTDLVQTALEEGFASKLSEGQKSMARIREKLRSKHGV